MGIKKLNKFLQDKNLIKMHNNIGEYIKSKKGPISTNHVIAVDFMLYFYKFSYAYESFILGFWNQISFLLAHRIIPIYVFDNKYPMEKSEIITTRNKKKDNLKQRLEAIKQELEKVVTDITIDKHIIDFLEKQRNKLEKRIVTINKDTLFTAMEFFSDLQIPFIRGKTEADVVCASLYKEGIIVSCLTDDTDLLCYGCESVICFQQSKIIEYNLKHILSELELSHEQFIEMCLLFGCDYLKPNFKMDIHGIYKNIKLHKTIKNIINKNIYPEFTTEKCQYFQDKYLDIKQLYQQIEKVNFVIPSITQVLNSEKIINTLNDYKEINMSKDEKINIQKCILYINNHISNDMLINNEQRKNYK